MLNRYSYGISVTGEFGPTTESRVQTFQEERCLDYADGIVGPETWNVLVSSANRCSSGSGDSASRILDAHNRGAITLWNQTFGRFDGADPLSNITDAANGRAAKTSCYGTAPCTDVQLDSRLLNGMDSLIQDRGFSFFVTTIAGASHSSSSSLHYAGRAVDVDEVNGVLIRGDSAAARSLMDACRALGAIEVFGPSNDPVGHSDHIHCAW